MNSFLKKYIGKRLQYNWMFGLALILFFGIPRFVIVLQSYVTRNYSMVMLVFLTMWFVPFIFLSKSGRRYIGIKKPNHYWFLCLSFIAGIVSCMIIFSLFLFLFDKSIENAFVYIGGNNAGASMPVAERHIYFWIAAIPSMLFSPIGEEFLYRGIVHGSFVSRFGEWRASVFDSLAFALTHVAHFGIVYILGNWQFLPLPATIWVLSMFFVSQVLFRCKLFCDSIWGAVLAHAGFNFAMMYFIFYHIL